jgi:mono/diheme cytochrome c family protein
MKCVAWISILIAMTLLAGCKTKSVTQLEYMPDMARQISVRAQEFDPTASNGIAMRQPVAGTVPREYQPYPYDLADTTESGKLVNPLPATSEVLERGRKYFNTYCIVCHGPGGGGDGFIIPKFTKPPPLFSDKVVNWPDGRIYHTITLGQGLMPSYASQLLSEQRWAVIRYVRELQKRARADGLTDTEKKR